MKAGSRDTTAPTASSIRLAAAAGTDDGAEAGNRHELVPTLCRIVAAQPGKVGQHTE